VDVAVEVNVDVVDPVATGIFDPIFKVACCPSVARTLGFCRTRVSESDSSALTVPPPSVTAKFVALRLPSVFSVIPEVVLELLDEDVEVDSFALLYCGVRPKLVGKVIPRLRSKVSTYLEYSHVHHDLCT